MEYKSLSFPKIFCPFYGIRTVLLTPKIFFILLLPFYYQTLLLRKIMDSKIPIVFQHKEAMLFCHISRQLLQVYHVADIFCTDRSTICDLCYFFIIYFYSLTNYVYFVIIRSVIYGYYAVTSDGNRKFFSKGFDVIFNFLFNVFYNT